MQGVSHLYMPRMLMRGGRNEQNGLEMQDLECLSTGEYTLFLPGANGSGIRELVSHYGKIDIMWFDFSYGKMSGEKWKATELVKMVRELQPGIIIDNRFEGNMEVENPEYFAGNLDGLSR